MSRKIAVGLVAVGLGVGCATGFGQGEPPKVETMAPPQATAGQTAAATGPSPAMWVVKKGPATVYLFGTVHMMKKDVPWETPKVEAAFKASSTLWLEIADTGPAAQAAMKPMILQMGMDADHPLSGKISKEDVAALDAELKSLGAPGEGVVDKMQPWLVYLTLSVLPAVKAGFDPANGIDQVLQKQAETAGKKVKGFETAEEQVHYLADFPQAEQVVLLHDELEELPKSVDKTNEMVADWEHGDVDKIAAMENDELKAKHPELYQKLLVDRNVAIAQKVEGMLKDPTSGTVFVEIGAAHLAGPDSIQKLLEKDGFVAERVE
jgi:uncharacterized protein YbaP (TraB family)